MNKNNSPVKIDKLLLAYILIALAFIVIIVSFGIVINDTKSPNSNVIKERPSHSRYMVK